jgi:uncharacterized protein YkwD
MIMRTPTEQEQSLLDTLDRESGYAGAKPLSFDGELLDAADAHAEWIAKTSLVSHLGENGYNPGDRMALAGYDWQDYGDNVLWVELDGAVDYSELYYLKSTIRGTRAESNVMINKAWEEVGISLKEGTLNGRPVVFASVKYGIPDATERAQPDDVGTPPPC